MDRRDRRLIGVIGVIASALALIPGAAVADGAMAVEADSVGWSTKARLFFETGGFAGGENEIPGFRESRARLYNEFGIELEPRRPPGRPGHRVGLAFSLTIGHDDYRFGVGPRITYRVHPRWAVQGAAGFAWSSEEENSGLFDQGWQLRGGILHGRTISVSALYQNLPYLIRERPIYPAPGTIVTLPEERGRLRSLYGGIMLHDWPGLVATAATWVIIGGLLVLFLASGAAS